MGQLSSVRSLNCDEGQGYIFGKAMPRSNLDEFIDRNTRKAAA